jgi:hypothetical protein
MYRFPPNRGWQKGNIPSPNRFTTLPPRTTPASKPPYGRMGYKQPALSINGHQLHHLQLTPQTRTIPIFPSQEINIHVTALLCPPEIIPTTTSPWTLTTHLPGCTHQHPLPVGTPSICHDGQHKYRRLIKEPSNMVTPMPPPQSFHCNLQTLQLTFLERHQLSI